MIVGGVAGGMSAATRLRRLDEHARIIVIERSGYVSFANCGLPYHVGGVIEKRSALLLQTPSSLAARFGLEVRVGTQATAIDTEQRTITVRDLASGTTDEIGYDTLILSRVPGPSDHQSRGSSAPWPCAMSRTPMPSWRRCASRRTRRPEGSRTRCARRSQPW